MNWVVAMPVALPLLVAAVVIALSPVCRRWMVDSVSILTTLAVGACVLILLKHSVAGTIVYWFGDWKPRGPAAIGISFAIDPAGALIALLCAFLMLCALVFSWRYFKAIRTLYHALMLIFLAAMEGFCLTGDLFNLFVFFELMSVSAYVLTGYKVEEESSLESSINIAVINSLGAFLFLMGIALVYGRTGALNLAQIGNSLAQQKCDNLISVAFALMFCGLLVKAAAVPFHFWLSDAHAVAPTPVCIIFSGVMVELGIFGVFRIYWTAFHRVPQTDLETLRALFVVLGSVTAVVGAIMCFMQRHMKRLLAFSTISHTGMMLVGAGTLVEQGTGGALLYLIGHGLVKAGLFVSAGLLLQQFGSVDEMELRGKGRGSKVLATIFIVGAFGLSGFPPFGTYQGKALMEDGGARIGYHWLPWLFLVASALTGGAVLRAAGVIFFGMGEPGEQSKSPTEKEHKETSSGPATPGVMIGVAAALVVTPVVTGVFHVVARFVEGAGARFSESGNYARAVIDGMASGRLVLESAPVKVSGIIFGFAAVACAVAVAVAGLTAHRWPRSVRRLSEVLINAPAAALRRIHSGHVGDYTAWFALGAAAVSAAMLLFWRSGG